MNYTGDDHTFAICAYKENAYLKACIKSLMKQSVKSHVIIVTSTPNAYITALAEKYKLTLYVNENNFGIGSDWNFAYSKCETPLVTIAHQDDLYEHDYTEKMLRNINGAKSPIIFFSGYSELRGKQKVLNTTLLRVKRAMLYPLKIKSLQSSVFVRRRILSLGCPICCPSVTFVGVKVGDNPFGTEFVSDLDWQLWERLSKEKGEFVYDANPLVSHRIYKNSTTTAVIEANKRTEEDYKMYLKFWPKTIAKLLIKPYSKSQKSNKI